MGTRECGVWLTCLTEDYGSEGEGRGRAEHESAEGLEGKREGELRGAKNPDQDGKKSVVWRHRSRIYAAPRLTNWNNIALRDERCIWRAWN